MSLRFLLILTMISYVLFSASSVEGAEVLHTHDGDWHNHIAADGSVLYHNHGPYTHSHEIPPGSETHYHDFDKQNGQIPLLESEPGERSEQPEPLSRQGPATSPASLATGPASQPLSVEAPITTVQDPGSNGPAGDGFNDPFAPSQSPGAHELSPNCDSINGYSLKFDGKTLEVVAPEVPTYTVVKLGFGEVDIQGKPQEPICGLSFLLNSRFRFNLDYNTPYSLKDLEAHIRDSRNWASRPDCVKSLQAGKLEELALYVMPSGTLCLVDQWKLPEPEVGGFAPRMPQSRGKLATLWGNIKRKK